MVAFGALLVCGFVLSHEPAAAQPARGNLGVAPKGAALRAPDPAPARSIVVIADRDDDDADEVPDGEADALSPTARADLVAIDARSLGARLTPVSGREHARIIAAGKPLAWGEPLPRGAAVQGLSPGRMVLLARDRDGSERALAIDVHGVGMRDGEGHAVDLARAHASLERTPPKPQRARADGRFADPDALRLVIASPEGRALGPISVESVDPSGARIDALSDVALAAGPCDAHDAGARCRVSAPLRFVVDDVDRSHSLVASRSIRAAVGGAIVVRDTKGKKLQAIRVAGPRTSPVGPIGRFRLAIRAVVMRVSPNGAPAVGGTDAGALAALRQELALASATWGQCGITFGPSSQLDVEVVSPPPPYLVAIGDDLGLPASGGQIRMRVAGRAITVPTKKGWSTRQVALEVQRRAARAGFVATVSENARISPGAAPSVDVAVKHRDGRFARVELVSSSDPTLSVVVGGVDLSDGLQHFGDTDSVAGTLEERALVKSVDDGDPRTIEVIVVPFFAGGGRIGESFIASDGSSMRNVVLIDRAGVRARRTSLTLAHELGHVILDQPGHPDDYGVDTPTRLMDSDASDASPFGPRRLTLDECARAVRQSGPDARVPLLTEWKLEPLRLRRR